MTDEERAQAEADAIAAAAEAAAQQKEEEEAARKAAEAAAGTGGAGGGGKAEDKEKTAAEKAREGYEQRRAIEKERVAAIEKELADYKRRDEEARKAELSKEQALQEERDRAVEEATKLKREIQQAQIGAEFKLPRTLWGRITGTDEDGMRADAEELAKFMVRAKVGATTDPSKEGTGSGVTFKRSQLQDRAFFMANEKAIMQAYREGRIEEG